MTIIENCNDHLTTETAKATCSKCGQTKPVSEFWKDASRADGLQPWCKACKSEHRKPGVKIQERKPREPWRVGHRIGSLTVTRVISGGRRGLPTLLDCECDCGGRRNGLRASNVPALTNRNCGDLVRHPATQPMTYSAQHGKLKHWHGSASDYACVLCGERAHDWAFLHRQAEPCRDADGKEAGYPWSPFADDYVPLCLTCHHGKFDRSQHREVEGDTELSMLASLAFWGDRPGGDWIDAEDLEGPGMVYATNAVHGRLYTPPTLAQVESWEAHWQCSACGTALPEDAPSRRRYCSNACRVRMGRWQRAGEIA